MGCSATRYIRPAAGRFKVTLPAGPQNNTDQGAGQAERQQPYHNHAPQIRVDVVLVCVKAIRFVQALGHHTVDDVVPEILGRDTAFVVVEARETTTFIMITIEVARQNDRHMEQVVKVALVTVLLTARDRSGSVNVQSHSYPSIATVERPNRIIVHAHIVANRFAGIVRVVHLDEVPTRPVGPFLYEIQSIYDGKQARCCWIRPHLEHTIVEHGCVERILDYCRRL